MLLEEVRVAVTGAGGRIGQIIRSTLSNRIGELRLLDRSRQLSASHDRESVVQADVGDLRALEVAFRGTDCVVHLAGVPQPDDWEDVLATNIVGTRNVFEAARHEGVAKVIFASSHHAFGFHARTELLTDAAEYRPDTYYGLSKCFGELLGRMYSDKYDMRVAALRIGTLTDEDRPLDERHIATWISKRDMAQLIELCISSDEYRYLPVYAVSANTRRYWSNAHAAFLGYSPEDNSASFVEQLGSVRMAQGPGQYLQGGVLCEIESGRRIEVFPRQDGSK